MASIPDRLEAYPTLPAPQTEVLITVDGVEHARHVIAPGDYVIGWNSDCALRVDGQPIPKAERTRLWPSHKISIGAASITLRRLQGEAPTDRSLAPAQMAIRRGAAGEKV